MGLSTQAKDKLAESLLITNLHFTRTSDPRDFNDSNGSRDRAQVKALKFIKQASQSCRNMRAGRRNVTWTMRTLRTATLVHMLDSIRSWEKKRCRPSLAGKIQESETGNCPRQLMVFGSVLLWFWDKARARFQPSAPHFPNKVSLESKIVIFGRDIDTGNLSRMRHPVVSLIGKEGSRLPVPAQLPGVDSVCPSSLLPRWWSL